MKKTLLCLAVMLLFIVNTYSQATFNTGALKIDVSEYGRIRLATTEGTKQLERASILVGTSASSVYDYTNDANTLDPTILVSSPTKSDFEIYGSYDNSYSSLPPDVIEKLNAYGWNNGGYTVVKYNITNTALTEISALIGLDIIPSINDEYGYDSVSYNGTAGVIRFHRGGQVNMGMKLLSASLTSLYSFEWYDGYSVDADYWTWMNHGSLQPLYASATADGPVSITSQAPVVLAPLASVNVYYAMALGADEASMLANISAAIDKYEILITSVEDIGTAVNGLFLGQNHPNPFRQSTEISYNLPDDGFVSLKIYNVIGNEVATLVNTDQSKGPHTMSYNANDLPTGVYFYTIRFNDQIRTNKMFLIK